MEMRDNTFLRQFEFAINDETLIVEYSLQDRKVFLTKLVLPDGFENEKVIDDILIHILNVATDRKLKVVPIYPKIALFFRKNPIYKSMLPPGIRI